MPSKENNHTHFGFRTVATHAKAGMVQDIFANVASNYDMMNDVMSLGAHRIWKTALVDWLAPRPNQKILDLAGGTGDIAFKILDRSPNSKLTVLDLTEEMVAAGRAKEMLSKRQMSIEWVVGDALNMPFKDNSFDVCVIGFGIRNFADISLGLVEINRILKTGGRLLVLEFSDVQVPALRRLYDKYSFGCIPFYGKWLANDRDSYQYLVESIRKFPNQRKFVSIIESAGYSNVKFRNLSMGIAALHSGWKI